VQPRPPGLPASLLAYGRKIERLDSLGDERRGGVVAGANVFGNVSKQVQENAAGKGLAFLFETPAARGNLIASGVFGEAVMKDAKLLQQRAGQLVLEPGPVYFFEIRLTAVPLDPFLPNVSI